MTDRLETGDRDTRLEISRLRAGDRVGRLRERGRNGPRVPEAEPCCEVWPPEGPTRRRRTTQRRSKGHPPARPATTHWLTRSPCDSARGRGPARLGSVTALAANPGAHRTTQL